MVTPRMTSRRGRLCVRSVARIVISKSPVLARRRLNLVHVHLGAAHVGQVARGDHKDTKRFGCHGSPCLTICLATRAVSRGIGRTQPLGLSRDDTVVPGRPVRSPQSIRTLNSETGHCAPVE